MVDELKKIIKGEIVSDADALEKFSEDASIFKIKPALVVQPKNSSDIKNLVAYVLKQKKKGKNLSLTARSAGTDMTGGPLSDSIVVDFLKHFNHIGDIKETSKKSRREGTGVVGHIITQPGVFYRDLEKKTLKRGLLLPSYPASKDLCSVGGMINNNSGGEKNLVYGKTEKYVLELKVILSDGNEYVIKPLSKKELDKKIKKKSFEGRIYKELFNLILKNQKLITSAKPDVSKNSAGYYLWNVWDGRTFDLPKLIVGAQGTLGLVTEAKLGLVRVKQHSRMVIVFLNNLDPLAEVEEKILRYKPESFESYDDKTLKLAFKFFPQMLQVMKAKNMLKMMFQFLPDAWIILTRGFPKLVLLAEFTGDDEAEIVRHITPLYKELLPLDVGVRVTPNEESGKKYWTIRRESFSLLRKRVKGKHTAPFIDDVIVHPKEIKEFLPKLNDILSRYKELVYTIAGHAGDANFHIIPLVDFSDPRFHRDVKEVSEKVYDLVAKYNGSITAEHNDGLIRTPYLSKMYKPSVLKLFKEVKKIFDPQNIFNPRKKVNGDLDYAMDHIKPN